MKPLTRHEKKLRQSGQILSHGLKLLRIFTCPGYEAQPVALCKKLRRLEVEGNRHAERICNDEFYTQEAQDKKGDSIEKRLLEILGPTCKGVGKLGIFVNLDPRGYALKIQSEDAEGLDIHKDWGGFGIIAPEITGD